MKNCQYCGRENPDTAIYCRECGTGWSPAEQSCQNGWSPTEQFSKLNVPVVALLAGGLGLAAVGAFIPFGICPVVVVCLLFAVVAGIFFKRGVFATGVLTSIATILPILRALDRMLGKNEPIERGDLFVLCILLPALGIALPISITWGLGMLVRILAKRPRA